VFAGHLEGDLGARVRGADDEDAAVLKLRSRPVLAGMQLHDARIELGGEGGHPWSLVRARRHDDAVGGEPAIPRRDRVVASLPREAVHAHTGPDRELE
jgi:hypothetical protein